MTLTEALRKTVILWSYLARHRGMNKPEAYKALKLEFDFRYCPLCEYTKGQCFRCPLGSFWPGYRCVNLESAYTAWRYNGSTRAAQSIANAATKQLKETENVTIKREL